MGTKVLSVQLLGMIKKGVLMIYIINVQQVKEVFSGKTAVVKCVDKKGSVTLVNLKDNSSKFIYTASAIFNLANYLSDKNCKSTFIVESVSSGFINRGTLVEVLLKAIFDYESGKPFLSQYKKSSQKDKDFTLSDEIAKKLGIKLNKGGEIEIKYCNSCNASSCLNHKIDYILMVTQNGIFNVKVKESDYKGHISFNRSFDNESNKIIELSTKLGF